MLAAGAWLGSHAEENKFEQLYLAWQQVHGLEAMQKKTSLNSFILPTGRSCFTPRTAS